VVGRDRGGGGGGAVTGCVLLRPVWLGCRLRWPCDMWGALLGGPHAAKVLKVPGVAQGGGGDHVVGARAHCLKNVEKK